MAGDIASGPCQAARATVAMYATADKIAVRQGSGLAVLAPGEADCIAICGMGGSTIISILAADMAVATSAKRLVLQPMAGAAALRRWLVEQGWRLTSEALVDDPPHFYEIICAERGEEPKHTEAEYLVGPSLLQFGHPLLERQIERQIKSLRELLNNMERSERAKTSEKYRKTQELLRELEVLAHEQANNGCHGCRIS